MADKPPGRLGRLLELGRMTGRVAGSYVREQVRSAVTGTELGRAAMDRLHIENAQQLAESMSRLKGAAMKVGQQLAMFAESLDLPPEVAQAMGRLHANAEPVPFDVIREEIERELERPLLDVFARFEEGPLGTASLAQAHAATLPDGREVVVKVLHRGVDRSVQADLLALKAMMLSQRMIRRSKDEVDRIFDEVKARLMEELDYLQEAVNLSDYQRVWRDDPRLRVPAVHVGLSTSRVLTLDRIPGVPLDRFVADASPEALQRAGETLATFFCEQVFVHRMLHADPHPGNYLFQSDGTVGVLDFGCVKRFDRYWMAHYARVAIAMLEDDRETALRECVALGAWDGGSAESADALWGFIRAIGVGFRSGTITLGAADEDLVGDLRAPVIALLRHPNITPPTDVIMLHRSLGGLYALSRRLGLRSDFGREVRPYLERAAAG